MVAMVMSQVACAKLGGLQALPIHSRVSKLGGAAGVASTPRLVTSLAGRVRCEAGKGEGPLADAKAAVDQQTKTTITKDDILRNQETNESEKKSVFGTEPTSGSLYPRPEVERRPETGSKSFFSVFAFDGAAPETINCRLVIIFIAHGYGHPNSAMPCSLEGRLYQSLWANNLKWLELGCVGCLGRPCWGSCGQWWPSG
jgi:hypothetical protein